MICNRLYSSFKKFTLEINNGIFIILLKYLYKKEILKKKIVWMCNITWSLLLGFYLLLGHDER